MGDTNRTVSCSHRAGSSQFILTLHKRLPDTMGIGALEMLQIPYSAKHIQTSELLNLVKRLTDNLGQQ